MNTRLGIVPETRKMRFRMAGRVEELVAVLERRGNVAEGHVGEVGGRRGMREGREDGGLV